MQQSKYGSLFKASVISLAITTSMLAHAEEAEPSSEDVAQNDTMPAEQAEKSTDVWSGFGSQRAIAAVAKASETLDKVKDSEAYKQAQGLAKDRADEYAKRLQEQRVIAESPTYTPSNGTGGGYFNEGVDLQKPTAPTAKEKLGDYFGKSASESADSEVFSKQCPYNFASGNAPRLTNSSSKLAKHTYDLCFNGFAVKYSGVSKTPLWSAEYLTSARLRQASNLERVNSFHAEDRIPDIHRASLADYRGSGYDRGHLAPNADMATTQEQYDSFSLANITPQDPALNRNLWREIEHEIRGLVYKHGNAYVVTGVTFNGSKIKQLNKSVLVPTAQYKAVYIPSTNQAGAYYTPNDSSMVVELISLSELEQRVGFDVMPSLASEVKEQVSPFPLPDYSDFDTSGYEEPTGGTITGIPSTGRGWLEVIIEFIKSIFKML